MIARLRVQLSNSKKIENTLKQRWQFHPKGRKFISLKLLPVNFYVKILLNEYIDALWT